MKRTLIMAALAGMLCACGGPSHKDTEVRNVSLTFPTPLKPVQTKSYPGIVREAHSINLGFKTAGQLARIYAKEGDYVQKGQLLARLDDADYRLGVEALQIQYDQLKDEVARTRKLFSQKSISANDYEKASAGLKQLGVQLQTEKNRLDYTRLCAPTDGYVQTVNFSPSEMVDAGTAVFTLLDVSHIEVEADIPVNEYRQRSRFIEYSCKVNGTGQSLPMRLLSLTPKADGNQLYRLRLALDSRASEWLTAGMNVEVNIDVADSLSAGQLTVPLRAVFLDEGNPCVWVFNADSTVTKRPVVLGKTVMEGRAIITEGLSPDERIVRAGVNVLREGQHVGVIEEPDKTNVGGML